MLAWRVALQNLGLWQKLWSAPPGCDCDFRPSEIIPYAFSGKLAVLAWRVAVAICWTDSSAPGIIIQSGCGRSIVMYKHTTILHAQLSTSVLQVHHQGGAS